MTYAAATNLIYGGTSADTFTANGGLTMNSSAGNTGSLATIIIGGGIWSDVNAYTIHNNITLAGNITLTGTIEYYVGTLTYSTGTITAGTSILQLYDGSTVTLNTKGMTWNYVNFINTTCTLLSDLSTNTLASNNGNSMTFAGNYNITTGVFKPIGNVTLVPSQTLNITSAFYSSGTPIQLITIRSTTTSLPTYINYAGAIANEGIAYTNFTDVIATATPSPFYGPKLLNFNGGTLTRTQGIVNVNGSNINKKIINYSNGV